MTIVAWIVALLCFSAGIILGHRRRSRAQHEANVANDAAGLTQRLHASVLQLEGELSTFRDRFQSLSRRADKLGLTENTVDGATGNRPTEDATKSPTSNPALAFNKLALHCEYLTEKLTSTRLEIHEHVRLLVQAADTRFDPETGLGNQREANKWLEILLALMARYGNQFAVALVAIDELGDESETTVDRATRARWLNTLGELIPQSTRETDVVARYGSDELIVIMPETNAEGAAVMAGRVTQQINERTDFTVSLGVAGALGGDNVRTLVRRADAALFGAQQHGGSARQHTGLEVATVAEMTPVGN